MAIKMTDEERRAFLLHGTRTGKLAVVREDGTPHAVPIWFVLDGDDVIFNTGAATVKGRALLRDRVASMCVDDDRPPFAYVTVAGPVEISDDLDEMLPWATRIAARYMGAEQADAFGRRNAVEGELLLRLKPERVVATKGVAD
jgi:PPOX class probable F420-dependent enzyme